MSNTLCWKCTKPGTGCCSWDRELAPVAGWEAIEDETDGYQTYQVLFCPEFQEMDWEARKAARNKLRAIPVIRCSEKGLQILTQELLKYYDGLGLSLEQIHERTGVPTGVIYARRMRSRNRER